jgi:hypothetical protein
MILDRLGIFLCVAAFGFAALPAANAANGALPTIDLQTRCRNSENTLIKMMDDSSLKGRAFDSCMKSEQEARDALLKAWPEIPPSYKSYCVQAGTFSPSYVEWIACVELMIDLRKQRATTTNYKMGNSSKRCPAIEYADDGSIKRIRACAL